IESGLALDHLPSEMDFRFLLFAATIATCAGAFLIPSFQRFAVISVRSFERKRSMLTLMMSIFGGTFWRALLLSLRMPHKKNLPYFFRLGGVPPNIFILNALGIGLISTGVFSAL